MTQHKREPVPRKDNDDDDDNNDNNDDDDDDDDDNNDDDDDEGDNKNFQGFRIFAKQLLEPGHGCSNVDRRK